MSSLVRWQRRAQPPPHSHSQPVSFCRVESASKLSAVALQYNDSNLASQLESVWGFFFLHEDSIKLFPNCQLFKNYAKQRIHEPKSHLSQMRRKLVFTWQQRRRIQLLIFACLPSSLCCSSELQGGNAANQKNKKNKCTFHWSRSGNWVALIMNLIIPRPKWRYLLQSSLGTG